MRHFFPIATLVAALSVGGCAATHTAIAKRDLDVQNKMTDTIFLDPVGPAQRTVYVQVRNSSDYTALDLAPEVRNTIEGRGYQVIDDPDRANYWLQVNVLQVGKMDPTAAESAFHGGYGSSWGTAAAGAAIGGAASQSWTGGLIGGVVGGAVATVADAVVKDTTYAIITDVQVSERSKVAVREQTQQRLTQGRSGTRNVTADETTNMKRYQTRVMSSANQANLEFDDALPYLKTGMTRTVAGIF